MSAPIKKRVCIVGAGAAGMSAAYAFSLKPEAFDVTLLERSTYTGGMATSTEIDEEKYGGSYINDGVQGASPVFWNTFKLFEELGFSSHEIGMQVSFGKGEGQFWSNVFPSETIDRFSEDIKRFGRILKIIKTFEVVFALISVQQMLSIFKFKPEFGEVIVFPLVALFFGTGNQTPYVSCAILERVFEDPNMRLFEYSPTSFLASIPTMKAFPRLSLLYSTWADVITKTGAVNIRTAHEVTAIHRTSKEVKVSFRPVEMVDNNQEVVGPGEEQEAVFDEIIFACDADAALKLLGNDATWIEKRALGNVLYLHDVSVTHCDEAYMEKYYNVKYEESLASTKRANDKDAQKQFEYARESFDPIYFIRTYPEDKKKVEMSFNLTLYQPQFRGIGPTGKQGPAKPIEVDAPEQAEKVENPKFKPVFQTIFLDRDSSEAMWSIGEIDPDKVILKKWWKQQSHRVSHYGRTVPFMAFLNGRNRTHFAGAWTILNMHEIAIVSGFSAAYKLGAPYPFSSSKECKRLFALYLAGSHASRMRKEDREGFFM